MKTQKQLRPFGMKDKLGYMLGDLGNDFTFLLSTMILTKFYTDAMGVSAGVVGTIMMLARFVDAFTDVTMGRICDRSKPGAAGKFRPWLVRMCVPVAIASFLMYAPGLAGDRIKDWSDTMRIAYLAFTYLLWGSFCYTGINIPYGSMASAISGDPHERQSLSTFRSMGSVLAGVFVGVGLPMVAYDKITLADGTVKEVQNWKDSDDIIVCWNAWDYSLDLNIPDTARKIETADVSLDMLVKNSRLHPVPVARDSKEQQTIMEVQENILNGKEQTVIAQGDTQEIFDAIGNTSSKIDVLALTDPASAVHIQNISQYREDLLRWFWNIYGMDSRGTAKRAQQSVEEVDQGGDLSMVIPFSRWRARQEEVEQVRIKCGAPDAACDFSTSWKSRIVEAVTIDEETAEKLNVEEALDNIMTEDENTEEEAENAPKEAQEGGEDNEESM